MDSAAAFGLSAQTPHLLTCTIPQLLAFPTSLAALKSPLLWNASCWVTTRRLDPFEHAQIAQRQRREHVEWCHFASDRDSNVSLLIVFPCLESGFRTEAVMQKWTDEVVLPAFRTQGLDAGVLSQSYRIVRMTAEAEREETLNVNAPDTPLRAVLSKRGGATVTETDLANVWAEIEGKANAHASGCFRDLFLVAVCHVEEGFVKEMAVEESWRLISGLWDRVVDVDYVPVESVRAHARVTLGVQSLGLGMFPITQTPMSSPVQPVPTARKRKVDGQEDSSKRSRFEDGGGGSDITRPWSLGRPQTTAANSGLYKAPPLSYDGANDDMEL